MRSIHRVNRSSWIREVAFCEFELDGVILAVWESSGDTKYWIQPVTPTGWASQIQIVRDTFVEYTDAR